MILPNFADVCHLPGPLGSIRRERAICIFEHDSGRPITRHTGYDKGEFGAVKGYQLVIRSISTVGKYVFYRSLPLKRSSLSVHEATIIVSET